VGWGNRLGLVGLVVLVAVVPRFTPAAARQAADEIVPLNFEPAFGDGSVSSDGQDSSTSTDSGSTSTDVGSTATDPNS
jgi:hypothetical protein